MKQIGPLLLALALSAGCNQGKVAALEAKVAKLEAAKTEGEAQIKKLEEAQKAFSKAAVVHPTEPVKTPKERGISLDQWQARKWTEDEHAMLIILDQTRPRLFHGMGVHPLTMMEATQYQWEHGGSLANAIIHAEKWDTLEAVPTNLWMLMRTMRAQNPE